MRTLDIKGVRIGEGRPKTVVSLMADKDASDFVFEADRVQGGGVLGTPDCIEWRADFCQDLDPEAVAGACFWLSEELGRQPLIFTCRTTSQGGKATLSRDDYVALCRAVIASGEPDLVDVELWIGDELVGELVAAAHAHGVRVIVSHHDFAVTPSQGEMAGLLDHVAALGADICKLAVMAADEDDAERLMQATAQAHAHLDVPLLTIAMGEAGRITRLAGEAYGSALTFCAMGTASAPGQVELREAVEAMDALHGKLEAQRA